MLGSTWYRHGLTEDLVDKCLGSLGEHNDVHVTLNLLKSVSVELTPGPVTPGYEEKVQK